MRQTKTQFLLKDSHMMEQDLVIKLLFQFLNLKIQLLDAFFWAGNTATPSPNGFIIPDELGRLVK